MIFSLEEIEQSFTNLLKMGENLGLELTSQSFTLLEKINRLAMSDNIVLSIQNSERVANFMLEVTECIESHGARVLSDEEIDELAIILYSKVQKDLGKGSFIEPQYSQYTKYSFFNQEAESEVTEIAKIESVYFLAYSKNLKFLQNEAIRCSDSKLSPQEETILGYIALKSAENGMDLELNENSQEIVLQVLRGHHEDKGDSYFKGMADFIYNTYIEKPREESAYAVR